MATTPGTYNLDTTRAILKPDCLMTLKEATATFYEELDEDFDNFAGHTLIATYDFEEDWPTWEVHPKGDELVYLLSGATDFILWQDGKEVIVRVDEVGSYVVVPKGVWHTARPLQKTSMLFITPGEGTLNEKAPPPE